MKFIIRSLILLSTICGCNNAKSKNGVSEKESQAQSVKDELSEYSEKIVLLATIKNISYDSLYNILTDYYTITLDYVNSSDSSHFYIEKSIRYVSDRYHIAKARIASLIFSFKYEMLSKEEIIDEEFEKIEQEQQEAPEDSY